MHTIYKITNTVTNQVYIGQATNIKSRFQDYKKRLARGQPKLNESFLTYGTNNHVFEVLCVCTDSIADKLEIYFIDYYKSYFYKYRNTGLNLTRGGRRGSAHPEETKTKISASLTGKKQSTDTIEKKKIKNSKPLLFLGNTLIQEDSFPSLAEAARKLQLSEGTVRSRVITLKNVNKIIKQKVYYVRETDLHVILPILKKRFL